MIKWGVIMKKTIIIILILFVSGCKVNYELKIDNSFSETFAIEGNNQDLYNLYKNQSMLSLYSESKLINYSIEEIETDSKYKIMDISNSNFYALKYSFDFESSNYNDSNAINTCYELVSVVTKDDLVSIATSNKFNCFEIYPELETVTMTINSKYKVTQNNADQIMDNKYIWNINKQNASNKPIILQYDKSKKKKSLWEFLTGNIYLTAIFVGILLIILVIALVMKRKINKKNKI